MNEKDTYETAFRAHNELYDWLVLPFGLNNVQVTFRIMIFLDLICVILF